jgi:hypothetical protein
MYDQNDEQYVLFACPRPDSTMMHSRKRSWNDPAETDRLQKRACSNSSNSSSGASNRGRIQSASPTTRAIEMPNDASHQHARTVCMHNRFCMLTQSTCCVCSDKRPISYYTRVTSIANDSGYTASQYCPDTSGRSNGYCPGCQGMYRQAAL